MMRAVSNVGVVDYQLALTRSKPGEDFACMPIDFGR